jgi:hypothetical protein
MAKGREEITVETCKTSKTSREARNIRILQADEVELHAE